MDDQYHPQYIEKTAQAHWEEHKTFKTKEKLDKKTFYCLSMFPYPSGQLHVGHVRNYTLGDAIARFKRMNGYHVMHPIGWDAFGLPAEGAAIKHKTAPAHWTYQNIDAMKKQLKSLGFSFDWDREITTCKPEYYRWEQWFFTQLYKKGLVYRKWSAVNWCPQDCTVLANEQVEAGRCWRCDTLVERKKLPQWFLKITDYADELLIGLDTLSEWPEQVKAMQRNWIGRSEGLDIDFSIIDTSLVKETVLTVYTTRPDTLMGVTCLLLAIEHPISMTLANDNPELAKWIQQRQQTKVSDATVSTLDKQGFNTGLYVKHPLTQEALPVWIANYVLMDYGSGVVMAVPGHDPRDWEFAMAYQLPIKVVIQSKETFDIKKGPVLNTGLLMNSNEFDGLTCEAAKQAISDVLISAQMGARRVNYRLRDWGVSRQRYWGTPIPMRYLSEDQIVSVPDHELPVILPENVQLKGMQSPLKEDLDWQKVQHEGQAATRETDTFDTFMESSWYYARFCCPDFTQGMLDTAATDYWLPVDQYVGGIEHACMHLLYARFFHRLLRDMGLVKGNEPFKRLLCQGMVLADTFYKLDDQGVKEWISSSDIKIERNDQGVFREARHRDTDEVVTYAGMSKMSKSKNNGIDPQGLIDHYGADTVRLYMLFAAPPEQQLEWSISGVEGAYRFLKKFWKMAYQDLSQGSLPDLDRSIWTSTQKATYQQIHQTIDKVTDDFSRRQTFNTAIARIMELFNVISKQKKESNSQDAVIKREALKAMTSLLAPITPHIAHTLWQLYQPEETEMSWPSCDETLLISDQATYVVQVNGKVRARFDASITLLEDEVFRIALSQTNVQKNIGTQTIKKMIWVPGKLVSIVL